MTQKNKMAVFTDVDGTLLDEKYSFSETQPTVERLMSLEVVIVLVSSKTRAELEYYRQKLGISDPFISENGAGIFIPKGYFTRSNKYTKQTCDSDIIELGMPYALIREKLETIRKQLTCKVVGFGDMTVAEVAADTGLSLELAGLAKQREYTEPIRIEGQGKELFFDLAAREGLSLVRGDKYFHVTGNHDKGRAVSVLEGLYGAEFGGLESFGIGNCENDYSMLRVVDHAFFVKTPNERVAMWSKIISDALLCM